MKNGVLAIVGSFFLLGFVMVSESRASNRMIDSEQVYAFGLTYLDHIEESGEDVDPENGPPIFRKEAQSLSYPEDGEGLEIPSEEAIYSRLREFNDPKMIRKLKRKFSDGFPIMLDYEVEVGIVLLSDVSELQLEDPNFRADVGYFVANDISMRSIQILGEGQSNKYEYWTMAKSFPGFLPIGRVQVPDQELSIDTWPARKIETYVDGQLRQSAHLNEMVYSPRDMMKYLLRYKNSRVLEKGLSFLTGTPSGVAFKVNRWKKLLSEIFFLSRYTKLKIAANDAEDSPFYLRPGSRVRISLQEADSRDSLVQ